MLSIIAVIGKNKELGKDNKLLWHLPDDLKHFKNITTGHPVIMGRKTFIAIGSPLPERKNIIITRNKNYKAKGCIIVHSLKEAFSLTDSKNKEIFIIGGEQIYQQALPYADKLYLTLVDDAPEADAYFPDYSEFKNIISQEKKEYNGLRYKFIELTK